MRVVRRIGYGRSSFRRMRITIDRKEARGRQKAMAFRKDLLKILSAHPRSVSSLARELGLKRGDVEDDLRHLIRSARAAGHQVMIEPSLCRACGFTFGEDKLSKPGKCPRCRSTWLYEAQIRVGLD